MTYDEINERYHDAALDEDGESWEQGDAPESEGWDDPVSVDDDTTLDEDVEDADV